MNTPSDSQHPQPNADEQLLDAMLREHARAGAGADDAFLARLEAALDADSTPARAEKPNHGRRHGLAWSIGIAASVSLAATLFWKQRTNPPVAAEQIVSAQTRNDGKVPLRTTFPPELIEGTPKPIILPSRTPNSSGSKSPLFANPAATPAAPPSVVDQLIAGSEIRRESAVMDETLRAPAVHAPTRPSGGFGRIVPEPAPGNSERYGGFHDNGWMSPEEAPLSTFSIDVDTASYSNLRRMILDGAAIPPDAVRLEEMVNYFDYTYGQPEGDHPFAVHVDNAASPWNPDRQLVRIALKGREIARNERPPANLVFLLDVSGSMNDPRKLPLVKDSLRILLEELNPSDTLSIVVYAGAEGLALPPTACDAAGMRRVSAALDSLAAGGSTNGGAGIKLAYQTARAHFKPGGINRVILATDGDFNVGVTGNEELVRLVSENAASNVYLTVLGTGTGNLNDHMLESITNHGNGTYHYIDTIEEARRVFLKNLMSTLVTIAKDVKIQVEFNPAQVRSYRLLGYANRMLRKEDFANDRIDAGDIGSGHTVTAFYEIESTAGPASGNIDGLRYAKPETAPSQDDETPASREWLTVKLRYKQPEGDRSALLEKPFTGDHRDFGNAGDDFRFASSVAMTAMILRSAEGIEGESLEDAASIAAGSLGQDPHGLRAEFTGLVNRLAARGR